MENKVYNIIVQYYRFKFLEIHQHFTSNKPLTLLLINPDLTLTFFTWISCPFEKCFIVQVNKIIFHLCVMYLHPLSYMLHPNIYPNITISITHVSNTNLYTNLLWNPYCISLSSQWNVLSLLFAIYSVTTIYQSI